MQRRSSDSPPVLSIDTDDLAHVSTLQNSVGDCLNWDLTDFNTTERCWW
jgi:hypothetical protein